MPCLMASGQSLQPNCCLKSDGMVSDGLRLTFTLKKMENPPFCQMDKPSLRASDFHFIKRWRICYFVRCSEVRFQSHDGLRLTFTLKKMENLPSCQMLQATRGAAISQSGAPDLAPLCRKFLVMSFFLPKNEIKIGNTL